MFVNAFGALAGLAGGLGLFIYGMQTCSEGLQKMAANRLKHFVGVLTNQPFFGILVGTVVTVGLQSSSATSALVIGFVSAQMMTLSQALGVLLGSAIGSSLTAQLIAFKITNLALVLLFVGAILYLFSKRSRQRNVGQTLLGFGLIFYGMLVMSSAMAPVRDYPMVAQTLVSLERYPILEFMVALLVTAIIQSSPAFLALLMALATHGLVGPYAIVPFVLGAHLGGTVTGVISSLGAPGLDAKRAAVANFAFKLVNGLVFLPLYRPLTEFVLWSSPAISRQVANTHTLFSLIMAVVFLPFTSYVARMMVRLMPEKHSRRDEARFLDESLLELPELAVDQAHRQTLEMGRIVREDMLERVLPALRLHSDELIDQLAEPEQAVDSLYKKISRYVTNLGSTSLSDDVMERSVQVLYAANDLEHVGDILTNVAQIVRKISREELDLSDEGMREIEAMYNQVHGSFDLALKSFANLDGELASRVIKDHPRTLRLEKELRYSHFDRMHSGNPQTMATSSVHLDLIEALLRIDSHAVNIAQVVMGIV